MWNKLPASQGSAQVHPDEFDGSQGLQRLASRVGNARAAREAERQRGGAAALTA